MVDMRRNARAQKGSFLILKIDGFWTCRNFRDLFDFFDQKYTFECMYKYLTSDEEFNSVDGARNIHAVRYIVDDIDDENKLLEWPNDTFLHSAISGLQVRSIKYGSPGVIILSGISSVLKQLKDIPYGVYERILMPEQAKRKLDAEAALIEAEVEKKKKELGLIDEDKKIKSIDALKSEEEINNRRIENEIRQADADQRRISVYDELLKRGVDKEQAFRFAFRDVTAAHKIQTAIRKGQIELVEIQDSETI